MIGSRALMAHVGGGRDCGGVDQIYRATPKWSYEIMRPADWYRTVLVLQMLTNDISVCACHNLYARVATKIVNHIVLACIHWTSTVPDQYPCHPHDFLLSKADCRLTFTCL